MSAKRSPQLEKVRADKGAEVPLETIADCGYGEDPDELQMMKALAVAVNDAMQEKKIEPVDKDSKQVNEELYDLLARDDKTKKRPQEYFYKKVTLPKDLKITSPRVLAEVCLKPNAVQWVVESMIQRQFDIKWDTDSGEPDDYSFYDFCDTENTKKFFTYIPRRAHVKATLYKECRSKRKMLDDLLQMPKISLCPEVFVKTVDGWKIWRAPDEDVEEHNEGEFQPLTEDFSWIDPSIRGLRKFIEENADIQKPDDESLKQSLKKPTLYWAVVKDSDFMAEGENLKLNPIGSAQVYVGKANNGIKGRWIDSGSHCEMMKKCLDNVCAMTTYDPLRLEGIQLVDARLALAKVREEKTALFVMKTFGDDLEKAEIAVLGAEASLREAEEKAQSSQQVENDSPTGSSQTDDISSELKSLQADVEERKEELDRAKNAVLELKEIKASQLRAEGMDQLTTAEKLHRKGNRVKEPHKNIIPFKTHMMTWEPTNMACGMNFGN